MNGNLLKAIRAATTVTLIVGSLLVQHVAREQQSVNKQTGPQFSTGIGSELAASIIESGTPLITLVR